MKSPKHLLTLFLCFFCFLTLAQVSFSVSEQGGTFYDDNLKGKVICIDPGHGGTAATDNYRVGVNGEREEWVNLRVGLLLKGLLEEKGAVVVMTRTEDIQVGLQDRALLAKEAKADVFISIHHNATADPNVNFPIIYYHGSKEENRASVLLGKYVGLKIRERLFSEEGPISLVSDFTIFPRSGASVLRESYGIPGILAEASFFSNAEEENRLKEETYNRLEAEAFLEALQMYFQQDQLPVLAKEQPLQIPLFAVFQEAERMRPEALLWEENFLEGKKRMVADNELEEAFALFTLSARSFPDSYVAAKCHQYRALILEKWGRKEEADMENLRARVFYVELE